MSQEGAALSKRTIEGKLSRGNLKIRLGSEGFKQWERECNAKKKAKREARFAAMLEAEAVEAAAVEMAAKQPRTQAIAVPYWKNLVCFPLPPPPPIITESLLGQPAKAKQPPLFDSAMEPEASAKAAAAVTIQLTAGTIQSTIPRMIPTHTTRRMTTAETAVAVAAEAEQPWEKHKKNRLQKTNDDTSAKDDTAAVDDTAAPGEQAAPRAAAAAAGGLRAPVEGQPSREPRIRGGGGGGAGNDDSADTTASAAPLLSRSKWPDALPPPTPTPCSAGEDDDENDSSSSSCPYFLSVVCDATLIHWALHEPTARTVFHPGTFWKTSVPVPQQQTAAPSAFDFFSTFFPEKAIRAILGGNRPDTIHTVASSTINSNNSNSSKALLVKKLLPYWPVVQRVPVIFIYVIATNDATFGFLQHLTSRIPVRLIQLQDVDFFDTIHRNAAGGDGGGGSGAMNSMVGGVDRLAGLAAAQCIYGGPALVIHAGDANMSYAATDMNEKDGDTTTTSASATTTKEASSTSSSSTCNHHDALCHSIRVRCGSMGPGFAAKFFILQSSEGGSLSSVNFEEFQQYLAKLKKEQQQQHQQQNGGDTTTAAAPTAATSATPSRMLDAHSTKEEIMRHVVHETTSHLRRVIATWAKQALASPTFQRQQKDANDNAARGVLLRKAACNRLFYVCITGGRAGQILQDLLSSSSTANDGSGISYLHPDTALPKLPCTVNFVYQEFLVHHGISHLLLMHHERRVQQRLVASHPFAPTAAITANSSGGEDDYNLRTMAVGQRVAVKKQALLNKIAIVRGTVVSVQKRHLSSTSNNHIVKGHGEDDGNGYHIKYDDGRKDEMNGEELYDALVLYHARGEKTQRHPAAGVNEALEKMRNAKRAAAKEVANLLEQCESAVMKKLEAERKAAAAPTKASAGTICNEDKRVDVIVETTSQGRSSESSKNATAATATDDRTATKEAAATADEAIHPQASKEKSRFDADKPAATGVQAPESSKNVVVAASSISDTTVPKPTAETKESVVPEATKKPQTRLRNKTEASVAPTSVAAKKKATPTSSKKRQAASAAAAPAKAPTSASKKQQAATAAANAPKSASKGKTASAASKPKSASTASKRPHPSAAHAPESVKKPRKTSPRQRPSPPASAVGMQPSPPAPPLAAAPAAAVGPPLAAAPAAATGPILPPTKKSLKENPKSYEKQRVAKYFDQGLFFGQVNYYNSEYDLWRIIYDDNDKEDYDASDMIKHGELYELHKHEDPKRRN